MRQRLHALGAVPCTLIFGVVLVGIPTGLLLDFILVTVRGAVFISPQNAVDLTIVLALVAPTVGGLFGRRLWLWNAEKIGQAGAVHPEEPALLSAADTVLPPEGDTLSSLRTDIERFAASDPGALKARVITLAMLGYGYVLVILAVIVVAIVLLLNADSLQRLAVHGAIALAFLGVFVLSALWVRLEKPSGIRVTRGIAPELFSMLTELASSLRAPMPDEVFISHELNAGITEHPRFGIFGLPRRYLVIGLPLLESMPPRQFRAILAHELAHLARQHAQGTIWVARLMTTWHLVALRLQASGHWARWAFLPFFRWYAPRLELYDRALSRVDEYEADAMASSASSAHDAADALVRLHVLQLYMTQAVLPGMLRQSAERREPPHDSADRMAKALRTLPSADRLASLARQAMSEETLDRDTHPSTFRRVERLAAVSDRDVLVASLIADTSTPRECAADVLLRPERLAKLRRQVSDAWQMEMLDAWSAWHATARRWRETGPAPRAGESLDVAWARASWAASCESPVVAIRLLQHYLERDPDHVEAALSLGRLLVEESGDAEQEQGVALLERVHARNAEIAVAACAALESWYSRHGRLDDVQRVKRRAHLLEREVLSSMAERIAVTTDDIVSAHPLGDTTLAEIRRICAENAKVRRALVVRKQVRYLADQPCIMLVIEPDVPWYKPAESALNVELAAEVYRKLARANIVDLHVVGIETGGSVSQMLRAIPGTEVYRRSGAS